MGSAVDPKLMRHLDLARGSVSRIERSTVDLAVVKLKWNLEAIHLLVSRDPDIARALVVARRTCLKLLKSIRSESVEEIDRQRALSSLDRLEARLGSARPSRAAGRLGGNW